MKFSAKAKGLAALSASAVGLATSLVMLPSLAIGADITGDGSDSGTTASTMTTEEQCTWYVTNVPATIALAPADPDAEYEGNALDVSYTATDLDIRASGNVAAPDISVDATTFVDCTFYGTDNVTRPILGISIADSDFDATYGDSSTADATLDFSLDASNALDLSFSPDTTICGALASDKYGIWSVTDLGLYGVTNDGTETGTVMEIALTSDIENTPTGSTGTDDADMCQGDLTVGVTIPGNTIPASPGAEYTWTGPSVVFTLSTSTTDATP